MHGNLSQNQRERALEQFESGRVSTLVATDVAARGLDVDDITHVINFDPPQGDDDYVHRIGRTGRAGRSGNGVTFVLPGADATTSAAWRSASATPSGSRPPAHRLPVAPDALTARRRGPQHAPAAGPASHVGAGVRHAGLVGSGGARHARLGRDRHWRSPTSAASPAGGSGSPR